MSRQIIATPNAPKALGPYSQAVHANGFIFTAGQVAVDPATNQVLAGADVAAQTERVLQNLAGLLVAAGSDL